MLIGTIVGYYFVLGAIVMTSKGVGICFVQILGTGAGIFALTGSRMPSFTFP